LLLEAGERLASHFLELRALGGRQRRMCARQERYDDGAGRGMHNGLVARFRAAPRNPREAGVLDVRWGGEDARETRDRGANEKTVKNVG
jgi:hypothetical protein